MSYEPGGRADKFGNQYEEKWVIHQLLRVIEEQLDYIIVEPVGEAQEGVDIEIGYKDGTWEGQQCKGRNCNWDKWDFRQLEERKIWNKWKNQLSRGSDNRVALVSPLSFVLLEDLTRRARNTSGNPDDFLKYQLSNDEMRQFFEKFCNTMQLDKEENADVIKAIQWLSRIYYKQYPDEESSETLLIRIGCLFCGDEKNIYAQLVNFFSTEDAYGKKIDFPEIDKYLRGRGIAYKDLSRDDKILPELRKLNQSYKDCFVCFAGGFVRRQEFAICRQGIEEGKSLIIHGKAGIGKSGCTEDIIRYCEEKGYLYAAIKLDKRIPHDTTEQWGKSMNLPASITQCIHSVSKDKRVVLILDQLDALRWTQIHSGEALRICRELIREVEVLNWIRKEPISLVMVCRSYDFQNDRNIRGLFSEKDKGRNASADGTEQKNQLCWDEIKVGELSEETIVSVIGDTYRQLTKRLKELLRIPSNLYMWQQLEVGRDYHDIKSTNQLIKEWWKQIEEKAYQQGVEAKDLQDIRDGMIFHMEKLGRSAVRKAVLNANSVYINFLCSNGFIIEQNEEISFVHQSILDCFISDYMLREYYDSFDIEKVIGVREKQTPVRRYQIQMFLQQLLEDSEEQFVQAGKKMLSSEKIRFHVKYIFLELLNQAEQPQGWIQEFILEYLQNPEWEMHLVDNVVRGNRAYIVLLRNEGILETWMSDSDKRRRVIVLISSLHFQYEPEDEKFLEKHIFENPEEASDWRRCFPWDIHEGSDSLFELWMEFYRHYPEQIEGYLDMKKALTKCEVRTVRLLALMLECKITHGGKNVYHYVQEFVLEDVDMQPRYYREINDYLLPYIPMEQENIAVSDWSDEHYVHPEIERACVQILKKANRQYAAKEPAEFWERYQCFMGTGSELHNELLLDAFASLPDGYADKVIGYLCQDFHLTMFETTSGNGDELLLAKNVVERFAPSCSDCVYATLEDKIFHYIEKNAIRSYQYRITYNKESRRKGQDAWYGAFWGYLQWNLLSVLPEKRMSRQAKDLRMVLQREFSEGTVRYRYHTSGRKSVISSIEWKKLSVSQWKSVLQNQKLNRRTGSYLKEEKDVFVDNSLESFVSAFQNAVAEQPLEMIQMLLPMADEVLDVYVDALFMGLAYGKVTDNVPVEWLEQVILRLGCSQNTHRAYAICSIIENQRKKKWSEAVLNILVEIALHGKEHAHWEEEKNDEEGGYKELAHEAMNSVRGRALSAIGALLWEDKDKLDIFREALENCAIDLDASVQCATLQPLLSGYNIDKEWAGRWIAFIYSRDYRMAGFDYRRQMYFLLYQDYPQIIEDTLRECFASGEKDLIEHAGYTIVEFYFQKGMFKDIMENMRDLSPEQMQALLQMVIVYFDSAEYHDEAERLLLEFVDYPVNLELVWCRLFFDDRIRINRDKEFLMKLMSSKHSRRLVGAFVNYLEEKSDNLEQFHEVIFGLCDYLLSGNRENYVYGVENELSKLIIAIYDEVCDQSSPKAKATVDKCMDIWDKMFECQIGGARMLSERMME